MIELIKLIKRFFKRPKQYAGHFKVDGKIRIFYTDGTYTDL